MTENSSSKSDERRRAPRLLVDLEVDYGNEDNFLFAYICDISATGIFIRTESPEEAGTQLNVRFTPHAEAAAALGEDMTPLELEGEVIWVNPFRPSRSDSIHPGMGVRFIDLTADQRRQLTAFVKTFAYLGDDVDDDVGVDTPASRASAARPPTADDLSLD